MAPAASKPLVQQEGSIKIPRGKLARKVPKIKKTNNTTKDTEQEMSRQALVDLVDLGEAYPDQREHIVRYFIERVKKAEGAGKGDESFNEVTKLGAVCTVWMSAFLSSRGELTAAMIGKATSYDPKAVEQLCVFLLICSWQMRLPLECAEKAVLNLALVARAHECGGRMAAINWRANISDAGKINWGAVGVYAFGLNEDGIVTAIVHTPSGCKKEIDPEAHRMTAAWDIEKNWSDYNAEAKYKGASFRMCKFFGAEEGPLVMKLLSGESDVFKAHVRAAVERLDRAKQFVREQGVTEDAEAFCTPLKEKAKEATRRARAALEQRQQELGKKRKISIAGAKAKASAKAKSQA